MHVYLIFLFSLPHNKLPSQSTNPHSILGLEGYILLKHCCMMAEWFFNPTLLPRAAFRHWGHQNSWTMDPHPSQQQRVCGTVINAIGILLQRSTVLRLSKAMIIFTLKTKTDQREAGNGQFINLDVLLQPLLTLLRLRSLITWECFGFTVRH